MQLHEGTKVRVEDQVEQWVKVDWPMVRLAGLPSDVQTIAFSPSVAHRFGPCPLGHNQKSIPKTKVSSNDCSMTWMGINPNKALAFNRKIRITRKDSEFKPSNNKPNNRLTPFSRTNLANDVNIFPRKETPKIIPIEVGKSHQIYIAFVPIDMMCELVSHITRGMDGTIYSQY